MPSSSPIVVSRRSVSVCGRYPTSPPVSMWPEVGCSSPAIRRSRVDLPAPLRPISPVRPALKVPLTLSRAMVPSGHSKARCTSQ